MRILQSSSGALRALLAALMLATLAACGGGGGGGAAGASGGGGTTPTPVPQAAFYASWTAAMQDGTASLPGTSPYPAETFNNQTLRQVLRVSLGGDTLRVRVSNLFGKAPVTFSGVHVAKSQAATSDIDTSSDRVVTFSGQPSVTVPAGAEVLSDAVSLPVSPLSNIAVTMYFSGVTTMPTVHADSRQTAYVTAGNHLADAHIEAPNFADQRGSYFGLTAVEVSSTEAAKVVVAFGDSMIDGLGSALDAARRFPNLLDNRLKAAGTARTGVVNTGIAGNRWLNDFTGPKGSGRFGRDVLGVAGVSHAIILMGINDIGFAVEPLPSQAVSADQVIAAMASAIASAKAQGIKVYMGTLLPYRPAGYYSDDGEAKRQAVNAWIRANTDIAGVIDFDLALRDPADPSRLLPAYDSGDHLHPNDAGYNAMANAVDLSKLER